MLDCSSCVYQAVMALWGQLKTTELFLEVRKFLLYLKAWNLIFCLFETKITLGWMVGRQMLFSTKNFSDSPHHKSKAHYLYSGICHPFHFAKLNPGI